DYRPWEERQGMERSDIACRRQPEGQRRRAMANLEKRRKESGARRHGTAPRFHHGTNESYVIMICPGSLQSLVTPLRPMVRTRTHTTVPGVIPLNSAFCPLKIPTVCQSASFVGLPVFFCTSLVLGCRSTLYRATSAPLVSPWRRRKLVGAAGVE